MIDNRKTKRDSLYTMWGFLEMGAQKANYDALKDYCLQLRTMMTQKTAGQDGYRKKEDISFGNLDRITNSIVIEAMALVLSGKFEKKAPKKYIFDSHCGSYRCPECKKIIPVERNYCCHCGTALIWK